MEEIIKSESKAVFTKYEELPLLLSVEQLSEILGVGKNTAYEFVRKKNVKTIRVGRQIRIPKESLLKYLQR